MRRPAIKPGDICKFHKRTVKKETGNALSRILCKSILVVLNVNGCGTEGNTEVVVNMHYKTSLGGWHVDKRVFPRKQLWYTGSNIQDQKPKTNKSVTEAYDQVNYKDALTAFNEWLER